MAPAIAGRKTARGASCYDRAAMTSRTALGANLAAATLAAVALFWSLDGAAGQAETARGGLGAEVYAQHCASCHGDDLQGQPNWRERLASGSLPAPPHDETGHTWHHPDWQLFEITKTGRNPLAPTTTTTDMPAFEGVLTDAEIAAVWDFIKSQWPEKIRARQENITRNMLR